MKEETTPSKFHKSMGNVKDEEVSDGEIRLLQYIIRDCENSIVTYRLKELKVAKKIQKIWDTIKDYKELAQESRIFIDDHPLFAAMSIASGISPDKGRKLFYKRIEDKLKNKAIKIKKQDDKKKKN